MHRWRSTLTALPLLPGMALAGCSSVDDRGRAAGDVAVRLLTAVADQDGAGACALLAPETAAEVTDSFG